MRFLRNALNVSAIVIIGVSAAYAASRNVTAKEEYVQEPMPPGFQVLVNALEGPIFADSQGHALYRWPKQTLRQGDVGEIPGRPTCDGRIYRENAGLMSPYPGGFELPDLDTRPSCTDVWPPVTAVPDAKPVGKWSIVDRPDGRKQWAYQGWALYTSVLDQQPGDVLGASGRRSIAPKANVPSQFSVHTKMSGRLIATRDDWSVYSYDGDGRNKSNCFGACLDEWTPILAGDYARPLGEWTAFERTPGVRQWAFRGMPLYRRNDDQGTLSLDGSDHPGWHNVYTQMAPEPPKGFTMKDTLTGVVLGDAQGMTVYQYFCDDDAYDRLACDHPDAPQAYRFAVCGGGDVDRCVKAFPYVLAPTGAKSGNTLWTTMYINPKTGKKAKEGEAGALHVWAFRARPVYTFAGTGTYGDTKPFDIKANAWGEWNGGRNGYRAMVYRDLFAPVQ